MARRVLKLIREEFDTLLDVSYFFFNIFWALIERSRLVEILIVEIIIDFPSNSVEITRVRRRRLTSNTLAAQTRYTD